MTQISGEAKEHHLPTGGDADASPLPPCATLGRLEAARRAGADQRFSEAWEATVEAIQLRPFHPPAWRLLAEIAFCSGEAELARQCAERCLTLVPADPVARRFLAVLPEPRSTPRKLRLPARLAAPPPPQLTVCLIVKDEEQFLENCLRSVAGIASQIVVVDTGSTDRTVEIARAGGAEVQTFAWGDDFSAARNAALEAARGDWVLVLDADEELSVAGRAAIQDHLADRQVMAWRLPIVEVGREQAGSCHVPRLFRNAPGIYFTGRIHEQAFSSVVPLARRWGLASRLGTATILHYGYDPAVAQRRGKSERNRRLLTQVLFNLGLELCRLGRVGVGLEKYLAAVAVVVARGPAALTPEFRETLLTQTCTHLASARRYQELLDLLDSPWAKADGGSASLHFLGGLAAAELKQYRRVADHMCQCLATRSQPALSPILPEIRGAAPWHCLAVALARLNLMAEAEPAFRSALNDDPASPRIQLDWACFLSARGDPAAALGVLHELVQADPTNASAWQAGARITLSDPALREVARDWTTVACQQLPENRELARDRVLAFAVDPQKPPG